MIEYLHDPLYMFFFIYFLAIRLISSIDKFYIKHIKSDDSTQDKIVVRIAGVKYIREKTGKGMVLCKNTLVECNGDIEEAIMKLLYK